jgi:hypothetical protein
MLSRHFRKPVVSASLALLTACGGDSHHSPPESDAALVASGKDVFRFETFGDEAKWTDTLRMHEVIAAAVDPTIALAVGLKVDVDALPPEVQQGIKSGSVDLKSPQTTVTLLKLGAVVGVVGHVETVAG